MRPTEPGRPTLHANRLSEAPVIDGRVEDDPVWQSVAAATGFWQVEPNPGEPASEATEVRVAFSDSTLYVGVICFDSSAESIQIADSRRDPNLREGDSFLLVLDTYLDGQNGFVFGTNPAGAEYDGQVSNQGVGGGGPGRGGFNLSWDTSWVVESRVSEIGWSAELAIPFKSLRYGGGSTGAWGINFERNIGRNRERSYWSKLDEQHNLYRVSMAGTLLGLEAPKLRNLKLVPYVVGSAARQQTEAGDLLEDHSEVDAGLDLKYGLTSSLTLDVSYNTDFAQVEADDQQINLNRFSLFFPEKRPFFLENASLFSVGSPGSVELFFSRRIGFAATETVPILGGARLSGRAGATDLGFLHMQTEATGETPANQYTVARVSRELPSRSRVGAIVVSRDGSGSLAPAGDHNRTYGIDGQVGIGRFTEVSGYAAVTSDPDDDGDQYAYGLVTNLSTPSWRSRVEYTEVGDSFNPEVGFVSRRGYRHPFFVLSRRVRPASFLGLQEIRPRLFYSSFWDFDGFQESGFVNVGSNLEWRNGFQLELSVAQNLEGLKGAFPISSGVVVPKGTYRDERLRLNLRTDRSRALSGNLSIEQGGFFGGDRTSVNPAVRLKLGTYLSSELSWRHNDIDLPGGAFETNLGRLRVTYSFSTRLFLQALVQYNDSTEDLSTNLRFSWIDRANTGLFVVYNEIQELGPQAGPSERSLIVKYSRLIDVFR